MSAFMAGKPSGTGPPPPACPVCWPHASRRAMPGPASAAAPPSLNRWSMSCRRLSWPVRTNHSSRSRPLFSIAPLPSPRVDRKRFRYSPVRPSCQTAVNEDLKVMEPRAFYLPLGDGRFESTPATAGPWSADAQHGGPPSALLARAFERLEPDPNQRLARLTVEILRPVPVRPVTVAARIVRPGRRVTLLEGSLRVDGQDYLLARGWRIGRPVTPTPVSG